MFFLIKCAFWLAIVFWALSAEDAVTANRAPRTARTAATARVPRKTSQEVAQELAAKAAAAARDQCLAHPRECLGLVERLERR